MVETLAELGEQFQKNRECEMRLYSKVTGLYGGYIVDSQEQYYLKNINGEPKTWK